jgi:hypothetical protein
MTYTYTLIFFLPQEKTFHQDAGKLVWAALLKIEFLKDKRAVTTVFFLFKYWAVKKLSVN